MGDELDAIECSLDVLWVCVPVLLPRMSRSGFVAFLF